MITLSIADYCQNCANFSAKTDTTEFYCNGLVYNRETVVSCRNSEKCAEMYKTIIKHVTQRKEAGA